MAFANDPRKVMSCTCVDFSSRTRNSERCVVMLCDRLDETLYEYIEKAVNAFDARQIEFQLPIIWVSE